MKELLKKKTFWWNLFLILVFIWFVSMRFMLLGVDKAVHHHANFQIYINNKMMRFDDPSYYEEESACSDTNQTIPSSRAHMHDNDGHIIHVHDKAVTYNHFFNNLGFDLNDEILKTRDAVYRHDEGGKLRFILNGKQVVSLQNKVIESEDVLLIDFSFSDIDVLQKRYDGIPRDAAQYNTKQDPQSCAGDGDSLHSFWQRLKNALGF